MATITIKHRWRQEPVATVEADDLAAGLVSLVEGCADLRDADLRGANLGGADLRGADLGGANLVGANLVGANLRDANLRGANLRGADLRDANLRDADLRDANLGGADLGGANLRGADLRDANLGGANLRDANLRDADLVGANLRGADLRGADLRDANLRDADLVGANLRDSDLGNAPVVPGLHLRILEAIDAGGQLDMSTWHSCETTHCRAGWAVHLAGAAGSKLEDRVGPAAAGALISIASCKHLDGKVPNFFATDEEALEDIRRLAELERADVQSEH